MIDSDYSSFGKPLMKEYLKQKYGEDSVISVGTYSEIGLLSGLKDILRKEKIDFQRSNEFCKCFTDDISWEQNIENLKNNKSMYNLYLEHKDSIDMCPKIVKKYRQVGMHAGGVCPLPGPVYNYIPVMRVANTGTLVSAFVESGASAELDEFCGVQKIDVLGIQVLDNMEKTINLIDEKLYEIEEDEIKKIVPESYTTGTRVKEATKKDLKKHLYNIDKNDQNIYDEINKTTFGIFQFTGELAREMVKRVKPVNFEEMIVINSCARPGTSMFLDGYINYKENPKYPKQVNDFLKDTHGQIIYQEQVMNVFHEFGDFDFEETNEVRGLLKKLGKANKQQKDIDAWKEKIEKFSTNARAKGFTDKYIENFKADLEQLASYQFNRSHAYAYSYIALMNLYLARYFRKYYYSAILTDEATKKDALKEAIRAVGHEGFKILPPDVNESRKDFTPVDSGIMFGINAIKGIGEKPIESILNNRPYISIIDFILKNLGERAVTKRITEALVCGGAFDNIINGERVKYQKIVEKFYEDKKSKKIPEVLEELWKNIEENLICEKTKQTDMVRFDEEFLGGNYFYSIFPKDLEEAVTKKTATYNLLKLKNSETGIGFVPLFCETCREYMQKNGEMMLFFDGEDILGEKISLPIFASYYKHCKANFSGAGKFYWLMLYFEEESVKFGAPKFTKDSVKSRMIREIQV